MLQFFVSILTQQYDIYCERVVFGDVMTSLDMRGVSLTLLHLKEENASFILEGNDSLSSYLSELHNIFFHFVYYAPYSFP